MIPCASDNDSGSVDLQLSNLEDIRKDPSSLELTGKRGECLGFFFVFFFKGRRGGGKWGFSVGVKLLDKSLQLDFDNEFGP